MSFGGCQTLEAGASETSMNSSYLEKAVFQEPNVGSGMTLTTSLRLAGPGG